MEDWVKRMVGRAYRPTCCICGCDIHMSSFGAAKKRGRGAVFWHDRCYQERYDKTPEQYEEMLRAEVQTELDPEQQKELDRLRKGKGMAKTESVYAIVFENGKCWRERRDGYPTKAEGLFVCKTKHLKVKGKQVAWEAIDEKSGLRVIGPFGTKKECEAAITDEVIAKLEKHRANSAWRAAVRMSELVWARGSMPSKEYNRLSKQYKAEEFEKFKQQREKEEQMEKAINLKGAKVCITGTLPTMTRNEAFTRLKLVGGEPCERFNKKVTLFVIAAKAGKSKRKQADKAIAEGQQVRIIDGHEFVEALKAAEQEQVAKAVEKAAKRKGAEVKATVTEEAGVTAITMEPKKKGERMEDLKKQVEELMAELKSTRKELDEVWKENANLKAKKPEPKEVPPAPKAPGKKAQETAAAVSLSFMDMDAEGAERCMAVIREAVKAGIEDGTVSVRWKGKTQAPIRVEGATKPFHDELDELGLRWAGKSKYWYLSPTMPKSA